MTGVQTCALPISMLLATNGWITAGNLKLDLSVRPEENVILSEDEKERQLLVKMLEQTGNNRSKTARLLNMSRTTLYEKLKRYGIMQSDGYLADMKRAYIDSYFQFFVTFTKDNDITGNFKEDDKALVEFARPLTQVEPTKEGVTLTTFLKTSFNTYEVTQEGETMDTYNVGMMAKNEQGGSLTVISAQTLVDENILTQYTSFKNMEIVTNAVSSALGLENISIPEKSLSVTNNAVKNGFIIALPFMIVIPVLLIAVGLFTWSRKKKR